MDWSLGEYFPPVEHYALLRHVVSQSSGTAIEFGIGRGESTRIIADHMPVIGFGSTRGLPEFWRDDPDGRFDAGEFAFPLPNIPNATLVEGMFEDTLPGIDFPDDVALIHFDADLYSSTLTALTHVGPYIQPGTILIWDEWHGYASAENHEQAAFREWLKENSRQWKVLGHSHQAWAIRIV
jgi:predicted O-methyltransferase YrrM